MSGSQAAWSEFWAAGGAGPESGCLPNALKAIDAEQREVWEEVAQALPKGARVLDLATGDGAVLGKMRRRRPDLKLVGVDSSPTLPPSPKGMSLRAGVAMEALPFGEAGFDQVTSQFGYEYGVTARIASEVARVTKRGGGIALIVHHADGPILAHNLARRTGLEWAVVSSNLLPRARALVAARRLAGLATPGAFKAAPAEARARFGTGSVAEEFVTAILQTLELGRAAPPSQSIDVLRTLESRASNELARVSALAGAACDRGRIDQIMSQLHAAGFAMNDVRVLLEEGGKAPFAWLLHGTKL